MLIYQFTMCSTIFSKFKVTGISFLAVAMVLVSCKDGAKKEASTMSEAEPASKRIQLVSNEADRSVEVMIDGKHFTSYIYPKNIKKPVLYPLITPQGTKITRKFPLEPSVGERVDHPHHVGVWFNYGDVNGLDFWNNSDSIKVAEREHYGTIIHKSIDKITEGDDEASLDVTMDWVAPDGKVLLKENTTFIFKGEGDVFSIDRITRLTAQDEKVTFKDNKEGMLGIRTTRELEHPSDKPGVFTDANGIATKVEALDNKGVNGNYLNAEGIEGEDTWAKRSNWVNLRSKIGDEDISLVILDNKSNVGYPTYWHSRGYGLFAANPLGQAVFSDGKEVLNFELDKGESTTFKHRIIVASKNLDKTDLDSRFEAFSK
ncbi:Methane oxygenase PmoA [Kriegella aquimaris]|uniref:Methane oxygenase PmoA n=2 Tax=Kriegella aquimaris TaxID=192904 RepID=A0A1G9PV72_9FLAO|nr:Methane oxygenase PmoA [Kriegella aquimaris]